jgi:hypothetical protein
MFIQVIRGEVSDPEQVHAALDLWSEQLAAGAPGWLGSTAGVTEDGRFVALARFESEDAARRNSDRHEQGQWWMETSKLFGGEVIFRDSSDVSADLNGDPDRAAAAILNAPGNSWHKTRTTGPHSGLTSSAAWRWDTRAGPTQWPCTSLRKRRHAKANAKSRRLS